MERMMEFMLEHRAEAEVRQAKLEEIHAKLEERMAALADRQEKAELRHKSDMAALRKLIQIGMKMLARQQERLDRHDEVLARLSAGQEELRASLKAFLDSMNKGTNGHN